MPPAQEERGCHDQPGPAQPLGLGGAGGERRVDRGGRQRPDREGDRDVAEVAIVAHDAHGNAPDALHLCEPVPKRVFDERL